MAPRYGIQHEDRSWWAGSNLWVGNTIVARGFDSWESAQLAGLREIRDSTATWNVRLLPEVMAPREPQKARS